MRSLLTLSESPLEIAHAVVNAHPALLALDPAAAEIVAETIDAASGLRALATRISAQGPASPTGGWAIERPVGAVAGIPATSLVLSTETRESAAPVVSEVLDRFLAGRQRRRPVRRLDLDLQGGAHEHHPPLDVPLYWRVRCAHRQPFRAEDRARSAPYAEQDESCRTNAAPHASSSTTAGPGTPQHEPPGGIGRPCGHSVG